MNTFNDARVLRSEKTTPKVRQLKMLISNLETGDHGIPDLKKLQSISVKIEEALGDYSTEIDRLNDALKDAAVEYGMESQELRDTSRALNAYIAEVGDIKVPDVIITTGEWDWIKTRWSSNSKLSGARNVRLDVLALDDIITNAKGVKFVGESKRAWVQGEPELKDA
jgi:hypothetical protein